MTTQSETTTATDRLSTADFAAAAREDGGRSESAETSDTSGTSAGAAPNAAGAAPNAAPVERKPADRGAAEREAAPLFAGTEAEGFRGQWTAIQAGFVDEPRRAVEQADELVAAVMQRLAQVFADERQTLEQQWDRGADTDTEELRQALRHYRSFFDRLLAL